MPTDDGLWPNDPERILPARPESGEHDPERTIERGNPWRRTILGLDRELLAQHKLDDRLFLATPEEGEETLK
jgi:hypothetical protein